MRNPIYFLQQNVGLFPLVSAVIGGGIGFAVGSTGRIAMDSASFLYDTALYTARNFPYSIHALPGNIASSLLSDAQNTLEHAIYDGLDAGAVYSAGSLLLAKKIAKVFSSKDKGVK